MESDGSVYVHRCQRRLQVGLVVLNLDIYILHFNRCSSLVDVCFSLYTYDLRRLDTPRTVHMDHTQAVMDVNYSPTGKEFVSGSYDRTVRIFPVDKGRSRYVHIMIVQLILYTISFNQSQYW